MPHLRIIYDVDGWAYHNCAKGLAKYAPPDFRITMSPIRRNGERIEDALLIGDEPVDLFFDLVGSTISRLRPLARDRGWDARFIGAFSNGWPLHLNSLSRTYRDSDAVLISSRSYWEALGPAADTFTLPYGVDPTIFGVRNPPEERAPKVIWTGSHFHRTVKGYDDIILPLADRLREKGIAFEARLVDSYGSDRFPIEQMADWYNGATVILCASRAEGTPNPPLEAAACGCTVVSAPVGNMPELIRSGENGFLVERSVEAFAEGIEKAIAAYPRLSRQIVEDIRPWLWDRRAERFFEVFRTVIVTGHPPPVPGLRPRPVDLREDVTVFVTTIGMPSYPDCLAALARQDSLFRIEIIENVAPLTQALQMMLDNCRTPYFVQVDEDMILHPHAIRTLLTHAKEAGAAVAGVVYNLFDAHLGRGILGVKIYRHEIVRRYPWTPDTTVFERNRRIESDGHSIVCMPHGADAPAEHPHVLGLHGTKWTPRLIFERYYTLRLWRKHSADLGWTDRYFAEFVKRFDKEPDALNFYALMGMVAGTLAHNGSVVRQKDYRTYDTLPGFDAARNFLESFRHLEEEGRADGE